MHVAFFLQREFPIRVCMCMCVGLLCVYDKQIERDDDVCYAFGFCMGEHSR